MTTKVETGAKVTSKKGQGIITKIITKSSGYVEVTYGSGVVRKEMAFNLKNENGIALKSTPKKRAERPVNNIQTWKDIALSVNDKWNQNSTWKLAESCFGSIDSKGNSFIESLLNSMFFKDTLSEKQAFYLARFAVESGQLS